MLSIQTTCATQPWNWSHHRHLSPRRPRPLGVWATHGCRCLQPGTLVVPRDEASHWWRGTPQFTGPIMSINMAPGTASGLWFTNWKVVAATISGFSMVYYGLLVTNTWQNGQSFILVGLPIGNAKQWSSSLLAKPIHDGVRILALTATQAWPEGNQVHYWCWCYYI